MFRHIIASSAAVAMLSSVSLGDEHSCILGPVFMHNGSEVRYMWPELGDGFFMQYQTVKAGTDAERGFTIIEGTLGQEGPYDVKARAYRSGCGYVEFDVTEVKKEPVDYSSEEEVDEDAVDRERERMGDMTFVGKAPIIDENCNVIRYEDGMGRGLLVFTYAHE